MSTLLDTNILIRLAQPALPLHTITLDAVAELRRRGEVPCIAPQNLYEFWVVATRPTGQNGLGLSPAQAQSELSRLKALFPLLDETPNVLPQWERLVTQYQTSGKSAHDAHLVAVMMVHGIDRILSFNVADFQRYPTITVLDTRQVIASQPPTQ